MKKILWERFTRDITSERYSDIDELYRTKVPNGWLVFHKGNIVYIPDPSYSWDFILGSGSGSSQGSSEI